MKFWEFNISHKNNIAIIDAQNNFELTYGELFNQTETVLKSIQSNTKQLAFLFTENSANSIVLYISILKSGHAVLLLETALNEEIKKNLINRYKPELIFTPSKDKISDYSALSEYENYGILNRESEISSGDIYEETAVLLSTSGTTGSPKLVRLSYKNIQANASSIVEYLKIDSKERAITSLPMSYSYGLSVINSHLLAGGTIICTEKSILFRDFWTLFNQYECTSFAGVPYTYQLLQKTGFERIDLPTLRTMTQAGGRLNESLIKKFWEYSVNRNVNFFVMYGQTEATARISYVPPAKLPEKIGSIGIPIPGGIIKIFDNDTEVEHKGQTGEIVYYGDNVMLGYAESRTCLNKRDEYQGKLRTGDLASRDDDGYFYIKGRLKRFIKIYGLRINLDDVQKMIETHFGIPNACIGRDDLLQILIKADSSLTESEVKREVVQYYKINLNTVEVKSTNEIPTSASGKYDYSIIKQIFGNNV